jgi:hypothetical protein
LIVEALQAVSFGIDLGGENAEVGWRVRTVINIDNGRNENH